MDVLIVVGENTKHKVKGDSLTQVIGPGIQRRYQKKSVVLSASGPESVTTENIVRDLIPAKDRVLIGNEIDRMLRRSEAMVPSK